MSNKTPLMLAAPAPSSAKHFGDCVSLSFSQICIGLLQ